MVKLPELEDYQKSVGSLKLASRVLGQIRAAASPEQPNHLQHSIVPEPYGASSGELDVGGTIHFHYLDRTIHWVVGGQTKFEVNISDHNQKSLTETVFEHFKEQGHDLKPDPDKMKDETDFELNDQINQQYLEIQNRMAAVLGHVHAHLTGWSSAISLWPHGFDLSFLWFKEGSNEEKDPHMNFGFSPGLDDGKPYVYFYAWPTPEKFASSRAPLQGLWQKDWSAPGILWDLAQANTHESPESYLASALLTSYQMAKAEL